MVYPLSDYQHTPWVFSNLLILHYLHISEPSENTFINPFVYPLLHSAQLPYPCILDLIHSPNTQQTSEVVHLYSPNPRSLHLLSHHCLTTIHNHSHKHPSRRLYTSLTRRFTTLHPPHLSLPLNTNTFHSFFFLTILLIPLPYLSLFLHYSIYLHIFCFCFRFSL